MKKTLCIIILMTSINAFGQFHSIGIQGGASLTNVKSDSKFEDTKSRTGLSFGLNYEMALLNKFTIGADIIYSQNGMREKWFLYNGSIVTEIGSYEAKYYYEYLCIPIKIGYTLGKKFKGFARIGIVPSFIINANFIYPIIDNSANMTGEVQKSDIKDNFSKFDLGGLFELGCGYKLQNKIELFSFVGYRESLTSFKYIDSFHRSKLQNYGLVFSLGVKYVLNNK